MMYMLLMHHGTEEWDGLSEAGLRRLPALSTTPGAWMEPPEPATTVRVDGDRTLTTDGFLEQRLAELA